MNLSREEWFNSVCEGKIEIVEKYLKNGWNVNEERREEHRRRRDRDRREETALHLAVEKGHIEIVKLLLEHGADLNTRKKIREEDEGEDEGDEIEEETALHLVVEKGHIEIVKLLLEHGADLNTRKREEIRGTALHLAVKKGHIEIVKLLLEHGADVNIKDSNGVTALYLAKRRGDIKMFGFIRQLMEEKEDLDPNT